MTLTTRLPRRFLPSALVAVVTAVYFSGAEPPFLMVSTPAIELPGTIVDRLSVVYPETVSRLLTFRSMVPAVNLAPLTVTASVQ